MMFRRLTKRIIHRDAPQHQSGHNGAAPKDSIPKVRTSANFSDCTRDPPGSNFHKFISFLRVVLLFSKTGYTLRYTESCPSGRRCSTRNAVGRKASRVRIPNSPPSGSLFCRQAEEAPLRIATQEGFHSSQEGRHAICRASGARRYLILTACARCITIQMH